MRQSLGTQFAAVILPVPMPQLLLLRRNRIHPGITRGRKWVVRAGQGEGLGLSVNNNRTETSFSGLVSRLKLRSTPERRGLPSPAR